MKIIDSTIKNDGLNGGKPLPAINKLIATLQDQTIIPSCLERINVGIAFNGLITC